MSSCGNSRGTMLEAARGQATEAALLELEAHLGACADCREERARWTLLGALGRYEPPALGSSARRRILERLTMAPRVVKTQPVPPRRTAWIPVAVGFAAAAVLAFGVARARWMRGPSAGELGSRSAAVTEGGRLASEKAGSVEFAGAEVAFQGDTEVEFHPASRTLRLSRGEVDVDVRPGGQGHFRVTTHRFTVEVLGTRFVVAAWGVRTVRGTVRVLDLAERELAVVHAGETWSDAVPSAALPSPAAVAASAGRAETPPAVSTPAVTPSATNAPALPSPPVLAPIPEGLSAGQLLRRATSALADGNAPRVRELLKRALLAHPKGDERATAELLRGDLLRLANRPDEAIVVYRGVARAYANRPEGDTASFSVGQLLYERGRRAEAERALTYYLVRYPDGGFIREVRERLAELRPGD